jgi:hypothetical protein
MQVAVAVLVESRLELEVLEAEAMAQNLLRAEQELRVPQILVVAAVVVNQRHRVEHLLEVRA